MQDILHLDALTDKLRAAFESSSGTVTSNAEHVRLKWRRVASYLMSEEGPQERGDAQALAIELHHVFIGEGHKTELYNRDPADPALHGWHGVAKHVLKAYLL